MNGKKTGKVFLLLVMTTAFFTACGSEDDKVLETSKTTSVPKVETETPRKAPMTGSKNETANTVLEDALTIILDGCTKELVNGYQIDESFLLWMTFRFGEDTLYVLRDIVEQGNVDPQIWFELTGNSIHVLWCMYCETTGIQSYRLEKVYWKECASKERIVLDFTGDINLAENSSTTSFLDMQSNGISDCFSEALLVELKQADITMINNEFTYSTRGEPLEGKPFVFRANPERVHILEEMGIDIVSLANNHAYDYGSDALVDTLTILEDTEMPYVGAGRNIEDAMEPCYFIANGRKIAIVAATQIERTLDYTKEATENTPGVLKTLNSDKFVQVIKEANEKADYVIAFVHWGTEGLRYFGSDQVALSREFVTAGADAIIGGHTHCLQGCEYYEGVPIIYSLGNFWFNNKTLDTGISQLIINQDQTMDFRFLPCIQKNNKTYLVEEASEQQRILEFMNTISIGVTFDDEGYIRPLE